ncbi:MAG: long-chain fatty acid--CoA ligase [Gemmatimonadales bacterium]
MNAPATLNELFYQAMDAYTDKPVALRVKRGGTWIDLSYRDLLEQVEAAGMGLRALGINAGDRVAILSENRPEWAIVDYACLTARCADVPVYQTLPASHIAYILNDSGAVAICLSNQEQLDKILEIRDQLTSLQHIIVFDSDATGPGVLGMDKLLAKGREARASYPDYREQALQVTPDDLVTLVYTSGTTGNPKGVMLTHGNLTSNVVAALQVLSISTSDQCLSFLPLSHIFERMVGHYTMLQAGVIINYAESIEQVSPNMIELSPTVVLSVPRLYEKIYARVLENALSGSKLKKKIFFWAKRTAERWADYDLAGDPVPPTLGLKRALADKLVFSKLRARTGGKIRFFASGGAPLSPEIAKFFYAAGLIILEGYGLTETSPIISVNTFDNLRLGTVGKPLPRVEVMIADDGEILTRGPHVMKGYYHLPEATAEALDDNGWFHTGDIGMLDADGFLKITDRKKDIIVTAGGKNIAPQPIEALIKTNRYVLNAVMLGDKRKFPILLVVPAFDVLRAWADETGLSYQDNADLVANPATVAKVEAEVKKSLRDLAHYEVPKKMIMIDTDFTIEGGELTPKLSVKRRVVEQRYADQIEALYAEAEGGAHDIDGS